MKKTLSYLLFLVLCLIIIPGCKTDTFFEVQETMNPPKLTGEQEQIKQVISEHMGESFIFKYPLFNGRYTPVISETPGKDAVHSYKLAFCQHPEEAYKVHLLFLKNTGNHWDVTEDIASSVSDVEKVFIKDIDGDGIKEIIVCGPHSEDYYKSIYTYKFDGTKAFEMPDVPDNFFDIISGKE